MSTVFTYMYFPSFFLFYKKNSTTIWCMRILYQTTALLKDMCLFWFGMVYELIMVSYGQKTGANPRLLMWLCERMACVCSPNQWAGTSNENSQSLQLTTKSKWLKSHGVNLADPTAKQLSSTSVHYMDVTHWRDMMQHRINYSTL